MKITIEPTAERTNQHTVTVEIQHDEVQFRDMIDLASCALYAYAGLSHKGITDLLETKFDAAMDDLTDEDPLARPGNAGTL